MKRKHPAGSDHQSKHAADYYNLSTLVPESVWGQTFSSQNYMEAPLVFSPDGECVEGTAMDIVESDGKTAFKMSKLATVIIQPSLRLGYKFAKRIDYQDSGDIRLT